MKWTKEQPKTPGWYWLKNKTNKYGTPEIVLVRDYAGELAIGNATLKGWERIKEEEWSGPIPMPDDN